MRDAANMPELQEDHAALGVNGIDHLAVLRERAVPLDAVLSGDVAAMLAQYDEAHSLGIEPASAEVSMIPQNYVKLEGKPAQQMIRLMEALEENEDSKKVWSNADIEEKEIEASLA